MEGGKMSIRKFYAPAVSDKEAYFTIDLNNTNCTVLQKIEDFSKLGLPKKYPTKDACKNFLYNICDNDNGTLNVLGFAGYGGGRKIVNIGDRCFLVNQPIGIYCIDDVQVSNMEPATETWNQELNQVESSVYEDLTLDGGVFEIENDGVEQEYDVGVGQAEVDGKVVAVNADADYDPVVDEPGEPIIESDEEIIEYEEEFIEAEAEDPSYEAEISNDTPAETIDSESTNKRTRSPYNIRLRPVKKVLTPKKMPLRKQKRKRARPAKRSNVTPLLRDTPYKKTKNGTRGTATYATKR